MRRSRFARTVAAVFTAWFGLAMVEPAVLHACPVHDGAALPTSAAAHAHGSHEAAPASHPKTDAHCLCLGDCAQVAGVGLPVSVTTFVLTTTADARDTGLPDHAYVPVAAAHVIPFANGPPAV